MIAPISRATIKARPGSVVAVLHGSSFQTRPGPINTDPERRVSAHGAGLFLPHNPGENV